LAHQLLLSWIVTDDENSVRLMPQFCSRSHLALWSGRFVAAFQPGNHSFALSWPQVVQGLGALLRKISMTAEYERGRACIRMLEVAQHSIRMHPWIAQS
jgi:hypothetical protein